MNFSPYRLNFKEFQISSDNGNWQFRWEKLLVSKGETDSFRYGNWRELMLDCGQDQPAAKTEIL